MKLIAFAMAVALLVTACSSDDGALSTSRLERPPIAISGVIAADGLSRFVDDEAGVVCWLFRAELFDAGVGIGLSCLPIADTRLAGDGQ